MRDDDRRPIEIPVAGPGRPRYVPDRTVWLIPAAIIVLTVLAILVGALWR